MNAEQLRQSLKTAWLCYYREHRGWLTRLGIWVTCEGQRRPSSSFILATLSILEPELTQLLPLIVDLSSNPDRIVMALGLNFNPDEALETANEPEAAIDGSAIKMLPGSSPKTFEPLVEKATSRGLAIADESCHGVGRDPRAREIQDLK